MKKSLILVGLLSIGYAHAQQYDGKVGINTEEPTATLEVQASKPVNGNLTGVKIGFDVAAKVTGVEEMYGLRISHVSKGTGIINGYTKNYAIHTEQGKVGLGDDVMVKTKVIAPKSSITTNGHISAGFNDVYSHRAIFIGASIEAGLGGGTFVGFGTYKDDTAGVYKFKTSKDNDSNNKNRFLIFNDSKYGKVYFSPFIVNDGKVEQDFRPDKESIFTISHEGKKIGIGTIQPENKLHIKADADPLKLEGLQETSDASAKNLVVENGVVKIGAASAGLAQEVDGVIGNEIKDVITDGGLRVDGDGTSTSPLKVGIKEGGVTGTMLANGSVTGEKLAPSSVDAGKIAPNAVTGDKIANATIGADKLNIPGQADQVLTYKNGGWVAADAKGLAAGANKGDTLVWNGTSWVTKSYKVVRTAETSYTVTDEDLVVSTTTQPNFNVTLPTGDNLYVGRKVCVFVKDGNATGHFTPTPPGSYGYIGGTVSNCVVWDGTEWIPVVGG